MREPNESTSESVTRAQNEWLEARDRQVAEAASERARAEELWRRLEGTGDPKARRERVLNDPDFLSWAFCEKLCNESAELAEDDAGEALELVELALDLIPRVSGDKHLLSGMQEYIWKHLGNIFRVRGDLKRAREAFERAGEFFLTGITGSLPSLILRDRLSGLESALERDQGHLAEALRKINDAVFHPARDEPGRASHPALCLEKARLHRQLGQTGEALKALELAERDARSSDRRHLVQVVIECGDVLCDLGRHREVKKLPAAQRKIAESFPLERARLLCLDGRVAAGLGRLEEAQAALQKAQGARHDRALANLALLTLEIAALSAREGQTAELKSLAEQTLPLAEAPGLSREAAATLKLFCRLAAQEKLTAERAALFVRDFSRVPAGR
jgi:tetratricopeptide (TPR) repeat protein